MVATRRVKAAGSVVDDSKQVEKEIVKSGGDEEEIQGMKIDTAQDNKNKTDTDAKVEENSEVDADVKEEPTNSASDMPQDDSSSNGGDNKENPEAAATADASMDGKKTEEGNHNNNHVVPAAAAMQYPFYPPPPGAGSHSYQPYFPPMQSWGGGAVPTAAPPPPHYGGGYPHVYYPPPHNMHGMPYYHGGPTTTGGGPMPPHPHAYHLHYPALPSPQHFTQQPVYSPRGDVDDDDESKLGQSVGAVVKTYVKCAKARNPDVLIRRQKKNQASRKRADHSRQKMADTSAKPRHERTEEEQSQLEAYERRRNNKNERSKQRSRETKETIDYILSKPAHKRTKVEIAYVEQNMSAKQRKNEGDRLRRERLKKLGLDRQTLGGSSKPGVSARGPLPAEYEAKLGGSGGTSTDGSNNSINNSVDDAQCSQPPRAYHQTPSVMPGAAPTTSSSYTADSPYGGDPLPPHPYESWESHGEQVYLPPPPPLDASSDIGMMLTEAKASPSFAPPTPHAV